MFREKNMPNTDANSTVRELRDALLRMHLKLNEYRGQCYDECSTMSDPKTGIAVQIKSEKERALYIHCHAHSINLAVGDTMKVCPVLKDTIDNTYELFKLVKVSHKRNAKLHSIQAENNSSGSNEDGDFVDRLKNPTIKLFYHTQWTAPADCLNGVIRNFDELQKFQNQSLENCSCLEIKARIHGIKVYTLKFSYCFGIHLAHLILSHTNNLSQKLQGTQITAAHAQVVSRACVTTLESIRSENEFNSFWNNIKQFFEKHDEPHFLRRKNIPNRYMISKAAGKHTENVEEKYRRQYYAALDSVITCLFGTI